MTLNASTERSLSIYVYTEEWLLYKGKPSNTPENAHGTQRNASVLTKASVSLEAAGAPGGHAKNAQRNASHSLRSGLRRVLGTVSS